MRALIRRIDQSLTFTAVKGSLTLPVTLWHLKLWVQRYLVSVRVSTIKDWKKSFFHIKSPRETEWNGWMSSVFYFSGNGIYSSLLCFHLKQLAPEMPADNEKKKIYLHTIRRISTQQLTRLYSVSGTERGACIHYRHDLGFKFIQFEIPDNSKKRSHLQTDFQIKCCSQLVSLKCWGCTKAIS